MTMPHLRQFILAAAIVAASASLLAQSRPSGALTPGNQRPVLGTRFEHLPVAGQVHLMAGSGGANVIVQAGDEGLVFVDTSGSGASQVLLTAARALTPLPIRYVINTNADADHVGGNELISAAGRNFATPAPNAAGIGLRQGGGGPQQRTTGAQVYAHEAVLNRLSGAATNGQGAVPFGLWPSDTFFTLKKTLYFNGEPVELLHQPAAHTDGDVMVWFRKSDVVAAGDVYTPDRFPMIDVARGGTTQGLLDGLNHIIDIAVPRFNQQGGTLVVGGHGRIANESDVVEYRDMLTIVRDRIQLLLSKNATLDQVKAAGVVLDYNGIYGATTGPWTTDQFITAVYQDLSKTARSAPAR